MQSNKIFIIKRKVKHPRIELKTGAPILILPQSNRFNSVAIIEKHKKWLEQKLEFVEKTKKKCQNKKIYKRDEENLIRLATKSVDTYSTFLKKKPSKVSFRYMKTKWASCSQKNRITLNLMLKYLPSQLIKYVIFHEMAHLLIPNHSKKFRFLVERKFKNHSRHEEQLFGYWFLLSDKLPRDKTIILDEIFKGELVK